MEDKVVIQWFKCFAVVVKIGQCSYGTILYIKKLRNNLPGKRTSFTLTFLFLTRVVIMMKSIIYLLSLERKLFKLPWYSA